MKTTKQILAVGTIITVAHLLSGCGGGSDLSDATGKIAFETGRDGSSAIYAMDSDGKHYVKLASSGFHPALSPDGSKLAYVTDPNAGGKLHVVNTDGTGRATLGGDHYYCSYPSFSPDGSTIVFTRYVHPNEEICVRNSDGSGTITTLSSSAHNSTPSFSPDGSRIVFTSTRDNDTPGHRIHNDVCIMNSDGSDVRILTSGNTTDSSSPSFCPNGTKIAFTSNRSGSDEIYIMNADGSDQIRLTNSPGGDTHPTFSSDGSRIAFASHRDGNWDIYVMGVDGSNQRRMTVARADDEYPSFAGY